MQKKRLLNSLIVLLLSASTSLLAQNNTVIIQPPRLAAEECKDLLIDQAYECAETTLLALTKKKLKYPRKAKKKKIEGVVVVQFTVSVEGKLEDIHIERPLHPLLDKEALRIVKKVYCKQEWIPGKKDDKIAAVTKTLPIQFKLKKK